MPIRGYNQFTNPVIMNTNINAQPVTNRSSFFQPSRFSMNQLVYYKPHTYSSGGAGSVVNSRAIRRRT